MKKSTAVKRIKEFMTGAWSETEYGLRLLCGRPTPMKRFVATLVIGGVLAVANIYFVVSSIYNIGKRDAQFLELRHIESLKLPSDSIRSNHK